MQWELAGDNWNDQGKPAPCHSFCNKYHMNCHWTDMTLLTETTVQLSYWVHWEMWRWLLTEHGSSSAHWEPHFPSGHWHLKLPGILTQEPAPHRNKSLVHSSMSSVQLSPLYPVTVIGFIVTHRHTEFNPDTFVTKEREKMKAQLTNITSEVWSAALSKSSWHSHSTILDFILWLIDIGLVFFWSFFD